MFDITLITMGKLKEKFYISAAEEYTKRLGGYCKFHLLELPEELEEEIYAQERSFMNQMSRCDNLDEVAKRIHETFKFIGNVMLKQRDSYGKRQAMLALDYIEKNYADSSVTLNSVCTALAMSTSYFSTLFKSYTGQTPLSYTNTLRLENARDMLRSGYVSVAEAAEANGFESPGYFSRIFKKHFRISPSKVCQIEAEMPDFYNKENN